ALHSVVGLDLWGLDNHIADDRVGPDLCALDPAGIHRIRAELAVKDGLAIPGNAEDRAIRVAHVAANQQFLEPATDYSAVLAHKCGQKVLAIRIAVAADGLHL